MTNQEDSKRWLGRRVEQRRVEYPEFQKNLGRTATVIELAEDENGRLHVKTDDGVWCPSVLLSIL